MWFRASFLGLIFYFSNTNALAADIYDANTSVLIISNVAVGQTLYSNVQITLGVVVSVGSQGTAGSWDTYNPVNNQLTIPIVSIGSIKYYNVVITVGKILSVGSSCDGVATCYAQWVAKTETTVTPQPFNAVITAAYQPTIFTSISSRGLVNRSRYLISDSSGSQTNANFLSIGTANSSGYGATQVSFSSASKMQDYLASLIQAVGTSDGNFRFDSHLHPNYTLDFSSSSNSDLVFRNNFADTTLTNLGFVTFSYDSTSNLIQAKGRYTYSLITSTTAITDTSSYVGFTPTHTQDVIFSAKNYYLKLNSGTYSLVSSESSATKFYLYAPPIDFGIPDNFNPQSVLYTTAGAVPVQKETTVPSQFENNSSTSSLYGSLSSKYKPQALSPGNDATTKINANTMLDAISTAASSNNFSLRYNVSVYSAFRDGLLASKQVSDTSFDGAPGQWTVPYVYFTNEQDASGIYHPFMIIVSYANAPTPSGLLDIPSPPGQITTTEKELKDQKRTRYTNLAAYKSIISMRDYGLVADVSQNIYTPNSITENSTKNIASNVYTYHGVVDIGILINGATFFSTMTGFNGTVPFPSTSRGELSVYGCHVGQGGTGPHCHADGYQSGPAAGHGVYSDSDYLNATHPPLIGFARDGVALFARYRNTDTSMIGHDTTLEPFGGHSHDNIGFHYHAHLIKNYALTDQNGKTYTIDIPALTKGAYIGNINSVPYFNNPTASSFQLNKYLGGTVTVAPSK